jgi:hypothetical protein
VGETITVDKAKLRAGAGRVDEAAKALEGAAGLGVAQAMAALEDDLPEAVTSGAAVELSRAIAEVTADLMAALQGLAEGLEAAAEKFDQVDVVYGKGAGG